MCFNDDDDVQVSLLCWNERRRLSSVLWCATGRTHGSGDPLHQEPKHMDSDEEH